MLIAGPNLTIDRTLTIDELRPGEVLRFDDVAVTAGGKGVNVARVAQALHASALLVGFTPGHTGQAAVRLLADEGLGVEAVPVAGELRSTAVVLERGGRVTVMNEPGPAPRQPATGNGTSARSALRSTAMRCWRAAEARRRGRPRTAMPGSWRWRASAAHEPLLTRTGRYSPPRWARGQTS